MQNKAIKFNLYQKQIMQDVAFLPAKREIIALVSEIFSQLQQELSLQNTYMHALENALDIAFMPPKISRGENYKSLPYIVLDYPRYFSGNHIFTFRSMFWWGNFYSYSIFLQGEPLKKLKHFLEIPYMQKDENLFIGAGEKLWEYDFVPGNYVFANSLSINQIKETINGDFLKLSYKFPVQLTEDEIVSKGKECFLKMMEIIKMP